jgi:hypothetical protein
MGRHVDQAAEAEHGIDKKACECGAGRCRVALQRLVHEDDRLA